MFTSTEKSKKKKKFKVYNQLMLRSDINLPEHERIRTIAHGGIGKNLLDGLFSIQDDCQLSSSFDAENVSVLFGQLFERATHIKHVQERKIS